MYAEPAYNLHVLLGCLSNSCACACMHPLDAIYSDCMYIGSDHGCELCPLYASSCAECRNAGLRNVISVPW